jgi:phytoene/squalene synthetase
MRRDEHISGHWIWTDFFVKRQGCWQVVASHEPSWETVIQLSERTKAPHVWAGFSFCTALKVGADNYCNQGVSRRVNKF